MKGSTDQVGVQVMRRRDEKTGSDLDLEVFPSDQIELDRRTVS